MIDVPNTIEHERERFRTMNVRQLRTRLNKITDVVKIGNFINMCREYGYESLWMEAVARFDRLTGIALRGQVTATVPPEVVMGEEEKWRRNFNILYVEGRSNLIDSKISDKREGIRVIKVKKRR